MCECECDCVFILQLFAFHCCARECGEGSAPPLGWRARSFVPAHLTPYRPAPARGECAARVLGGLATLLVGLRATRSGSIAHEERGNARADQLDSRRRRRAAVRRCGAKSLRERASEASRRAGGRWSMANLARLKERESAARFRLALKCRRERR